MLLELVNATTASNGAEGALTTKGKQVVKTVAEYLEQADTALSDRYESLKSFIVGLGDDVQVKILKHYIAFKRMKNFACVEIHPQSKSILLYVKADLGTITIESGFTRDVSDIGHWGTGNLEITIMGNEDAIKAQPFITGSYEAC